MTQFGSNLNRYEGCGSVHHERVEECSCVSSSIICKAKRVNMSVTIVTMRFSSSLIFTISSVKASFYFNSTCRSNKVDHSLTKLNFFDKSCPRHSWSNLVEIPSQSLVTTRADRNTLYIAFRFHFMHVTRRRNKFAKLRATNVSPYLGTCLPLLFSVLILLLSGHTDSFSPLLHYTSLCTQLEHDSIYQLPAARCNFPWSFLNNKHGYNET